MNEFLEAADGWVPLITFIVGAVIVLVLARHISLGSTVVALNDRIRAGASVNVGNVLEVGQLVHSTDQLVATDDDVKTWGDPDQMQLLFKAQGRGWKKSTKAMQLASGCLVQVTTERQSKDGDWASAEALQFIPNVEVVDTPSGNGRALKSIG